jgi:glucose uptake protein
MIIIEDYSIAILFTILAMTCWGSWANAQKIAERSWRFELFYWDKMLGLLIGSLLAAFTLGSLGDSGRTFFQDLSGADLNSVLNAMAGGVLWNLGNLAFVSAIALAGMSVAFPVGGGIAWMLGILVNYVLVLMAGQVPSNRPMMLFSGMIVIIFAIFLSGKAYQRLARMKEKPSSKGIMYSMIAGLFIAFFYGFVVRSLDGSIVPGGSGVLTPFTAIVFFTFGAILSTVIINPILMRYPAQGEAVTMKQYWSGSFREHIAGVLGGLVWMSGMVFSFMAAGAANPAISYAMSNAAPVVAILWGLIIWKEFKGAPGGTNKLLVFMFVCYVIGLVLVTWSNV